MSDKNTATKATAAKPAKKAKGKIDDVTKLKGEKFVAAMIDRSSELGMRDKAAMPAKFDADTEMRTAYGTDAFGVHVGRGCHFIHVVLYAAHLQSKGEGYMTASNIDDACKATYGNAARPKGPTGHINTLRVQGYIEKGPKKGLYRLTQLAVRMIEETAKRCGSDDELAGLFTGKGAKKVKDVKGLVFVKASDDSEN